ncbi:MAG: maltose alpha-D-glucosyltransferase [Alphaproteobacteria bacterium]|nr:maltose alpha-D-glucosyltransferase [Alphaproteobacteria bacterium]MBV9967389.1 maltose alpha-D-glucosyltransferase [Alphaproteobacteria bacterium]
MTKCRKTKKARSNRADARLRDWYKDAIIYQLHVRAFYDSNDDGVGDFCGLAQKLDYIKDLGANAIWLLPFYESPLRDDGYDISDYKAINPAYGTLDDFRDFVEAAHARGIRIITELVINHSSDQHPWFLRARNAPPGSPERDYYVWSDTGREFEEARIIFLDSEVSNWTWDPVARAYYWHRFYACQPDLNFDNPLVINEIKQILNFWLDMGVDGFRLDAVPYLVERDGTDGENLRETHNVLKLIRAEVERRRPDCVLLAEANQPPESTLSYFGRGDECHMAFHFPLMPRLFMALAQENSEPVVEIIERTRSLPDGCQWALFLRNHDELTLEMVTEEERKYLWHVYATHRRLRINLGIRRRLATLLNGDRRRIELMNSLLFSLNGSPVVYYGDEIGMGDNPFLGDRDGVRTPMQWAADRNAGFSKADYVDLYLPPIEHRFFGYDLVNVDEQRKMRASLLNWMRWVVKVRQSHPAFAGGEIAFLAPANQKMLAYLRILDEEILLCAVNLSETAQAAELDLREWAGRVPVEMFGGCPFPAIREEPYTITLPGHEFLWLKLFPAEEVDPARGVPHEAMDRPDLPDADKPLPPRPREKGGARPETRRPLSRQS